MLAKMLLMRFLSSTYFFSQLYICNFLLQDFLNEFLFFNLPNRRNYLILELKFLYA